LILIIIQFSLLPFQESLEVSLETTYKPGSGQWLSYDYHYTKPGINYLIVNIYNLHPVEKKNMLGEKHGNHGNC